MFKIRESERAACDNSKAFKIGACKRMVYQIVFNAIKDALLVQNPIALDKLVIVRAGKKRISEKSFGEILTNYLTLLSDNFCSGIYDKEFLEAFCVLLHMYHYMMTPKKVLCREARDYLTKDGVDFTNYLFCLGIRGNYFIERLQKAFKAFDSGDLSAFELDDLIFAE